MADEYVDIVTTSRVDIKALRDQKQSLRDIRSKINMVDKDNDDEIDNLIEDENEKRRFFKDEVNGQIDDLTEEIDRLVVIKNG
jgi:hypothetical protein